MNAAAFFQIITVFSSFYTIILCDFFHFSFLSITFCAFHPNLNETSFLHGFFTIFNGTLKLKIKMHFLAMWGHNVTCQDYQDLIDRGWRR